MTEEGANKVSRRSFMKTAALAAGGAAGVALAAEVVTPLAAKEKLVFDSNQASLRAADQPKRNPPLDRNLEVDVAVIGGGFTGLSSAYHLKKLLPGKSVALLEARGVGHGASGRNGGMMLCQPIDEYMKIGDPKTHKRSYDETANAIDEVRDLMKAHGLGSGIWKLGALETCMSRERYESKKPYAAKAEAMGIPIEAWDRDRVADALGTDVYFGGLYDPNGAEVNPMKMVHALKRAAESEGCAIYEDSPVIGVEDGKQIALHVAPDEDTRYRVVASAVVLGTNGYTSKLGYMNWKVIALHTEMGATPPLGENIFSEIGWKSRITFHDDNAFLYHLGSTEDNRILIGGGNAEYFFNNGITQGPGRGARQDLSEARGGRPRIHLDRRSGLGTRRSRIGGGDRRPPECLLRSRIRGSRCLPVVPIRKGDCRPLRGEDGEMAGDAVRESQFPAAGDSGAAALRGGPGLLEFDARRRCDGVRRSLIPPRA
jgi:glycine/D-amino acid oxidase-like deaminating enzyme